MFVVARAKRLEAVETAPGSEETWSGKRGNGKGETDPVYS